MHGVSLGFDFLQSKINQDGAKEKKKVCEYLYKYCNFG